MTKEEFWWKCDVLEDIFRLSQTSGKRTVLRNDLPHIKGHFNSWHLPSRGGKARDWVADDMSPGHFEAVEEASTRIGLELTDETDHWHVEPQGS